MTASHNPARDNGVKLVDPTGEMLDQAWESYADALTRAPTADHLVAEVSHLVAREGIVLSGQGERQVRVVSSNSTSGPLILVGCDTRPSSPGLAEAFIQGAAALGVPCQTLGLLTTPQLHWAVARTARALPASKNDYCAELACSFTELRTVDCGNEVVADSTEFSENNSILLVDCANGVGALALTELATELSARGCSLKLELFNTGDGELNGGCGADYVQKARQLPRGFPLEHNTIHPGANTQHSLACCSLDGDADRIVFFIHPQEPASEILLLDGDRIAVLAALLCADLASQLPAGFRPLLGVVQTAYANGASTEFIASELRLPVTVTPTGVKHLHAAAHAFDVGIYFEANGHGTVVLKQAYLDRLQQLLSDERFGEPSAQKAARDLLSLAKLINQAIGDALSVLLLVVLALERRGWSLADWADLYADLPSRQRVCRVPDRTALVTADAERKVVAPAGLQTAIDDVVCTVPRGRFIPVCFFELMIQFLVERVKGTLFSGTLS